MKRVGVAVAFAVVLLGAAGTWIAATTRGDDVDWARIGRGNLVIGVEVTGTLHAVNTSQLTPPQLMSMWEFKISHMAPEGTEVDKGAAVLSFDTSELEQRLRRQQAEADQARKQIERTEKNLAMTRAADDLKLAEAEARLRKSRLKADTPTDLVADNEQLIARLDLELAGLEVAHLTKRRETSAKSAEAQLETLRSQLDRAERQVEEIQRDIQQMTRLAPRDATVIYVAGRRDEKKKIGDSCWRGEAIIELPDLDRMKADGRVDEADAGRLSEGQPVTLRLDAHPDVEFHGSVESIWKTVQRKSWSSPEKVARLEVRLDETDPVRMRPGMRFRGQIEVERAEEALLLPVEAVFLRPGGPVVHRRTTFGHKTVPVKLGRRNADRVEVLEGVEKGDDVALRDLGEGAS